MFEVNFEKGPPIGTVDRRVFIVLTAAGIAGTAFLSFRNDDGLQTDAILPPGPPRIVPIAEFSDSGVEQGVSRVPKIVKSDRDWRDQLTAVQFDITRRADTEIAFTGPYWNSHQAGIYRCVCCDTALFDSRTKFDSGTGWPSFWKPIAKENVSEQPDSSWGMERTSVACARCDAHLGHLFSDGPPPTGLRYCINSVALRFVTG